MQNQQIQAQQSLATDLSTIAGPDLCFVATNTVVYFNWTVLGFVSEIVFNLIFVYKKTLFHKVLFKFLGKIQNQLLEYFL